MGRIAPKLQPDLVNPLSQSVFTEDEDDVRQLLRINRNSPAPAFKPVLIEYETPCFNLIHFSHSFPFFRDFLFPRIDCSSIATRSAHDHSHTPPRPAHPPHTMDGS